MASALELFDPGDGDDSSDDLEKEIGEELEDRIVDEDRPQHEDQVIRQLWDAMEKMERRQRRELQLLRILWRRSRKQGKRIGQIVLWIVFVSGAAALAGFLVGSSHFWKPLFQ